MQKPMLSMHHRQWSIVTTCSDSSEFVPASRLARRCGVGTEGEHTTILVVLPRALFALWGCGCLKDLQPNHRRSLRAGGSPPCQGSAGPAPPPREGKPLEPVRLAGCSAAFPPH